MWKTKENHEYTKKITSINNKKNRNKRQKFKKKMDLKEKL